MISRELTFAEEAAIYEIEARQELSYCCDPDIISLIARGRRIISKAAKLIDNHECELEFYKRKVEEKFTTKEEIDARLEEYGYKKSLRLIRVFIT